MYISSFVGQESYQVSDGRLFYSTWHHQSNLVVFIWWMDWLRGSKLASLTHLILWQRGAAIWTQLGLSTAGLSNGFFQYCGLRISNFLLGHSRFQKSVFQKTWTEVVRLLFTQLRIFQNMTSEVFYQSNKSQIQAQVQEERNQVLPLIGKSIIVFSTIF